MSLSQFYPNARHLFATGQLSWLTGSYKVLLMASGYIPNFANQNLSDIPGASIIATSPAITGQAESSGYLTGNTISWGVINDVRTAGSLIFFKDTGVAGTSTLIAYVDTPDVNGFPALLNGLSFYLYQNVGTGWMRL